MEVINETEESPNLLSPLQKSKLLYRNFPLKDFRASIPSKETINDFIYLEKENILLFACFKKIYEYEIDTKKIKRTISAHDTNVSALLEIPAQYLIVSGGYDGQIILWEYDSWHERRTHNWGGWIYQLVVLAFDGVIGFVAGKKDVRQDCVFGIWNYNYGEVVLKVSLEVPGNYLTSKFCWLDPGKEIFTADKLDDLYYIHMRSGTLIRLNMMEWKEPVKQISAIAAYEYQKEDKKAKLQEMINDLKGLSLVSVEEKEKKEEVEKSRKKILIFVEGYKGVIAVLKTDRRLDKFVEVERREIGDKPINHIQVLKPHEKDKLIFVRSGDSCLLFDMDFTMLHNFNLGLGGSRITKDFIHLGVDNKILLFTSNKGDVMGYKMEDLIKYFLLKLMVLKSNDYHPYIYVEVFNMLFSNDNINI